MRSAAAIVAEAGADLIDINMGCPVRKVCKTGAGAALLRDPELALALARGAIEGGGGLPVTVKMRSGLEPGDRSGFDLAVRLAQEAGVAAIAFHPRPAATGHKGKPDYALCRELAQRVDVPVIVSGGLATAEKARAAYRESGAAAVMIARGALGNPWIFEELTGRRVTAAGPRRGARGAALDRRGRPAPPRPRPRHPLPAQVLSLVPGGARATCANDRRSSWLAGAEAAGRGSKH